MSQAIRIQLKKAPAVYDYAASKFFGDPAIPGVWQETFSEDEIFFGQLRLSEVAPFDPEGRLPHTGYLYFFLDTAYFPYGLSLRYFDGEPDTLFGEFNEADPAYAHLNQAFLMSFSPCEEDADGNRLFGTPSSDCEGDAPLLLQFDPLDTPTGFLEEIDGYAYIFCDTAHGFGGATFVMDRS